MSDIFDVLEGGEDEGTVRFLLGFNGEDTSVSLLSGVDGFVGMEGVGVEKYVSEPPMITMASSAPQTYIQPAGNETNEVNFPLGCVFKQLICAAIILLLIPLPNQRNNSSQ